MLLSLCGAHVLSWQKLNPSKTFIKCASLGLPAMGGSTSKNRFLGLRRKKKEPLLSRTWNRLEGLLFNKKKEKKKKRSGIPVLDKFKQEKTKKEACPQKRFSLGGSKKKRKESVPPKNLVLGQRGKIGDQPQVRFSLGNIRERSPSRKRISLPNINSLKLT